MRFMVLETFRKVGSVAEAGAYIWPAFAIRIVARQGPFEA